MVTTESVWTMFSMLKWLSCRSGQEFVVVAAMVCGITHCSCVSDASLVGPVHVRDLLATSTDSDSNSGST